MNKKRAQGAPDDLLAFGQGYRGTSRDARMRHGSFESLDGREVFG
jgi:hypothetical protein